MLTIRALAFTSWVSLKIPRPSLSPTEELGTRWSPVILGAQGAGDEGDPSAAKPRMAT